MQGGPVGLGFLSSILNTFGELGAPKLLGAYLVHLRLHDQGWVQVRRQLVLAPEHQLVDGCLGAAQQQ